MLPVEIVGLLSTLPFLAWICLKAGAFPAWIRILPLVAAGLMWIAAIERGYRWQMLPVYLTVGGLLALDAVISATGARVPALAGWVAFTSLAASVVPGLTYPDVKLPPPTGPYSVGTVVRHIVDPSRRETLGPNPQGYRELMIQVWYPATVSSDAPRALYFSDRRLIPSFWLSHLVNLRTYSVEDARPATKKKGYPVILYSPSWHGQRNQSTFLAEELASRGFVVVGIDHTYCSNVTIFPDGHVVYARQTEFWDLSSDQALQDSIRLDDEQVRLRERDLESVLAALDDFNRAGPQEVLSGLMDLDRLGALGFSFGGAVAAQACRRSPRFRAGVNLGGSLFAEAAETPSPTPLLFVDDFGKLTPQQLATRNPVKRRYYGMTERDERIESAWLAAGAYRLRIEGLDHYNFADSALFTPVRYLSGAGRINPYRAFAIIRAYTTAFFEQYLNGAPEPLLNERSRTFPEARLEAASRHPVSQTSGRFLGR